MHQCMCVTMMVYRHTFRGHNIHTQLIRIHTNLKHFFADYYFNSIRGVNVLKMKKNQTKLWSTCIHVLLY